MTLSYLVRLQVQMKKLRRYFSFVKNKQKPDKEGYRNKGLHRPKSQRKKLKPQGLRLQIFKCL